MQSERWDIVTLPKLLGFLIGSSLFFVLVLCSEPGFVFLVDHANLLFHEAGHPIVGLFRQRLEPYGGTVGQLVFPVVLMVHFWRKGQTLSFAGSGIWFFENWLNIARCMADARAMVLPLVGGGNHDWNNIFGRWDLLHYDEQIAMLLKIDGWIGMITICLWVGWRWRVTCKQRSVANHQPKVASSERHWEQEECLQGAAMGTKRTGPDRQKMAEGPGEFRVVQS